MTSYEKGFIEKCAEYGIDSQSIISEFQKQAQQKVKGASRVVDTLKKLFTESKPEIPQRRTHRVIPSDVFGPSLSKERELEIRSKIIKPVDQIKGFFTGKDPEYLAMKRMNANRKARTLEKRKLRMNSPS